MDNLQTSLLGAVFYPNVNASENSLSCVMGVNLICCDLCICAGIDQRAGIGLVIVCVGVQEVSIVTNGTLPLITGPHTHKDTVTFKHYIVLLFIFEGRDLKRLCAYFCLNLPTHKQVLSGPEEKPTEVRCELL